MMIQTSIDMRGPEGSPAAATELSVIERAERGRYEAMIERSLSTFMDVGRALLAMRDWHPEGSRTGPDAPSVEEQAAIVEVELEREQEAKREADFTGAAYNQHFVAGHTVEELAAMAGEVMEPAPTVTLTIPRPIAEKLHAGLLWSARLGLGHVEIDELRTALEAALNGKEIAR